jgi:NAD(P)-dependent dehydrogenase (short-subunit alcohol dehydrogenase family)
MDVKDRVAVVTGGGNGIGAAICRRLRSEGVAGVVVADLDAAAAENVACEIDGVAIPCDVGEEPQVRALVERAIDQFGRIDLYVSNAGVTSKGGFEVDDAGWEHNWRVNVMAHVYAARAVIPGMVARGEGYFLLTSSAAGLLTEIGSAPYSVTKHGTVAFAEWLSVHYQKQGIRVSCLCPAGVATGFLDLSDPVHQFLHMSSVTPDDVARSVIDALRDERFLVLPHKEVAEFFAFKGQDYDRWLRNFARLNEKIHRQASRGQQASRGRQPPDNNK